jgi:PleD family two-component response regulator
MGDNSEKAVILIVDDEPLSMEMLNNMLKEDHEVLLASSAHDALELIKTWTPDLILLDIVMPGMDGYEVCRQLKTDPQYREIPILFITVKNEVECEFQGLEMGAVDYIVKPYNPSLVRLRVKNHLELKQQRDLLAERAGELQRLNDELAAEVSQRQTIQTEHEGLIGMLREALTEVKTLSGLLPICSSCKKVRDDKGYWNQIENYISQHTDVEFSHGLCVECAKNLYPDYYTKSKE